MQRTVHTGVIWHDFWIGFFAVVIAIGFFMGQGVVIAFGAMGVVSGAVSLAWNRLSLDDVKYERHLPHQRAFLGEEIDVTVSLMNRKPLPLPWIRVTDELPDELRVVSGDVAANVRPKVAALRHQTSLAWYERIRWRYRVRCEERGLFAIGPASIQSGDPFGFLRSRMSTDTVSHVLVYPRVYPLEELGMTAHRPLGDVKGQVQIFTDPSRPMGVRDYRAGDPMKTIDWKSTARAQSLQVRRYEPSTSFLALLVVAVDTTAPHWAPYARENLERVVTAAASVASYSAERQHSIGLFSNDMPTRVDRMMTVAPGHGREQFAEVLTALAGLRAYAIRPMHEHLAQNYRRFPYGSTLVIVTSFMPPEFVQVINDLERHGHKMVVVYVGQEKCPPLPAGVVVHEIRERLDRLEAEYAAAAG